MADIVIEVKGADELIKNLFRVMREFPKVAAQALYEEAQVEAAESKRRTPIETGALRASTHVTKPEIDSDGIEVKIKVGGPSAPYALRQHEDLEYHHDVGQAKFLESTILESAPHMVKRVARRIDLNKVVK